MFRLLVGLAALGGAVYGGFYLWQRLQPPPLPPAIAQKAAANARQTCYDECEQAAIVRGEQGAVSKACHEKCGGGQPAKRPQEPIRSITRAPADHSAPSPKLRP
jgi:hypothetical protein